MSSIDLLQPWLRPHARRLLALAPSAVVTSTRRTRAQQTKLYRRFLLGKSQFPAAPPGYSKHEQGRAFDLKAGWFTLWRLGRTWESWGGKWGGSTDPIHFEA